MLKSNNRKALINEVKERIAENPHDYKYGVLILETKEIVKPQLEVDVESYQLEWPASEGNPWNETIEEEEEE